MTDTNLYSRVMEQATLGALLMAPHLFDDVSGIIEPDDFYESAHKNIFQAIKDLTIKNSKVDVLTVSEAMNDPSVPLAYLAEMARSTPVYSHAKQYAESVKEKSTFRQFAGVSSDITQLASTSDDIDSAIQQTSRRLDEIADSRSKNKKGFSNINDVMIKVIDKIDEMFESDSAIVGNPTGFKDLDEMTSGLQGSDLIIVAGRPSMGKTSFSMNIAENLSGKTKLPVAIFSMEMPEDQLCMRMLSSLGLVPLKRLRTGNLQDEDWPRITAGVAQLKVRKLFIDDEANLSPMEIRSRAKKLMHEHGQLGAIVIDYIQLMRGNTPASAANRTQEISDISRALKALAKELNVPVIALSQLNRSLEQRPNKRPVMSDLRESGAIEQDADIIMFVYRDEVYNPDSADKGSAEIIIAKQRNGPIGTVRLTFQGQYTKFGDYVSYGGNNAENGLSQEY